MMPNTKSKYTSSKSAKPKNDEPMDIQNEFDNEFEDFENESTEDLETQQVAPPKTASMRKTGMPTYSSKSNRGTMSTAARTRNAIPIPMTSQNTPVMNDDEQLDQEMIDIDDIIEDDTINRMKTSTSNRIVTNPNRSMTASMAGSMYAPKSLSKTAGRNMSYRNRSNMTKIQPMMDDPFSQPDRRVSFLEQFEEDDIEEKQLKSFQTSTNNVSNNMYQDEAEPDVQLEEIEKTTKKKSSKKYLLKYGVVAILVVVIAIILIAIIYLIYMFVNNNTINLFGFRLGDDSSGTDGNLVVEVRNENRNRQRREAEQNPANDLSQTNPGSTVINRVNNKINRQVEGSSPFIALNTVATEDVNQNAPSGFIVRRSRR